MNNPVPTHIANFISSCVNLTVATCSDSQPYCANCFYVFDENENLLICKSDLDTVHMKQAAVNNLLAGTILPNALDFSAIKGIQFTGTFLLSEKELYKKLYFEKFPMAKNMPGTIWTIYLSEIKMTDNSLGFGTKLLWSRGE
jgi:hypothetical protein